MIRTISPFIGLIFVTILQFWLLAALVTMAYLTRSDGLLHFSFPFGAYASLIICLNAFLMLLGKVRKWIQVRK